MKHNQTHKTHKSQKNKTLKTGGNTANMLLEYAGLMQDKEPFDLAEFEAFLDTIKNPLKQAIEIYPENPEKYTINELAIIFDCGPDVHRVFTKYDVAYNHKVHYPNILPDDPSKREQLTVLEAYVIQGIYNENIRKILEQMDRDNKYDALFNYNNRYAMFNIPSVFQYALEGSVRNPTAIKDIIYNIVVQKYLSTSCFMKLEEKNADKETLFPTGASAKRNITKDLLDTAISNNKPDLLIQLASKITQEETIKFFFSKTIVNKILLQNSPQLYQAITEVLNRYDPNIIITMVKKLYPETENKNLQINKKLFKTIAKHAIEHLQVGDIFNTPKLIVFGHGQLMKGDRQPVAYNFKNVCFFVEEGKILHEACIVNKSLPEMICRGNYDKSLQCIKNGDNMQNMVIMLKPTMRHDIDKSGIFYCENKQIQKMQIQMPNANGVVTFKQLMAMCETLCKNLGKEPNQVDVQIFTCRGFPETTLAKEVHANPVLSESKSASASASEAVAASEAASEAVAEAEAAAAEPAEKAISTEA